MTAILRSRCALALLLHAAVLGAILGLPRNSQAGVFLSMNFDDQANGEQIITTAPLTESPEFHAYSTGGFTAGAYAGTNTVFSDSTLSKAVLMATNQGGTGANFIDTQFAVVSADTVTLDFDLRIMSQSAEIYPQATGGAPNGQLFVVNAFGWNTPNRVFRFAATPTSSTEGIFAMRDNSAAGNLIPIGAYTVGTDYHVSIAANYLTGTVDASVNGVGSLTGLAFVDGWPGTFGMSEFFIFQNNVEGQTNQVALDNMVGATVETVGATVDAVPEPSSLAIFALGSLCCAGLARRRGKV